MEQSREDRRVRKTKARLRQALTGLMAQKEIKDITVKELTEGADVNRGTFYSHYRDIYDMIAQVEDTLFEELGEVLDAYTTSDLRAGLRPILEDVFTFVRDNADFCRALLSSRTDSALFQRLYAVVYSKCLEEWGELYGLREDPLRDYYMNFLVSGVVGLIQVWVSEGLCHTPGEMAALAEELIRSGVSRLADRGKYPPGPA